MANNSRPVYQHIRTYNSGLNGDGQPLAGDVNEGEIAINLATKRLYTSRNSIDYYPADSENTTDSDHVNAQEWASGASLQKVGAVIRVYGITAFPFEPEPLLRVFAGITLSAPNVNVAPAGGPAAPAHFRYRLNGGVDSDLSVQVLGRFPVNQPYLNFTNPLRVDSDLTGAGFLRKFQYATDNQYVTPNPILPQSGWPGGEFDSEYPNATGWRVIVDQTPLSPSFPDSGTIYIWYQDSTSNVTQDVVITPDSDFVRYVNYTQDDVYAVIQSSTQFAIPSGQFPFYTGHTSPYGTDVEVLVDSTPFLPFFTSRTYASGTPVGTVTLRNAGTAVNTILLSRLQGNTAKTFGATNTYLRARLYTDSDQVVKLNNVPFIGQVPPGGGTEAQAGSQTPPETGDIWIDNSNGPTLEDAAGGIYHWFDDTLRNHPFVQNIARGYAQEIHTRYPSYTDAQIRQAMISGIRNSVDPDLFDYPARNLVFVGPDSAVLLPTTVWNEWRAIPSVSNLDPQPELRPYVPDYGLRADPNALGRHETFTNPNGIDSDAWRAFIENLEPNRSGTIAVRRYITYYGLPPGTDLVGMKYYPTSTSAVAADVYVSGVRLVEGVDWRFAVGRGFVYPITSSWNPLPTDEIVIVYWSPSYRETITQRTVLTYYWYNTTRDSDILLNDGTPADDGLTDVYVNGVRLSATISGPDPADYQFELLPDGSAFFVNFIDSEGRPRPGDTVTIVGVQPDRISFLTNRRRVYKFPIPVSPTTTSLAIQSYVYDSDGIDVQLNGVSLEAPEDYNFTTLFDPVTQTTETTVYPSPALLAIIRDSDYAGSTLNIVSFGTNNDQ